MSQFPPASPFPPPGDLPYAYGDFQPARPGSINGLAITGIILGSLGILCNGVGLLAQAVVMSTGKNPMMPNAPVISDPVVTGSGAVTSFVSLAISIWLLASSIGALYLKPAARRSLIKWSVVTLIWAVVLFVVQVTLVIPATADLILKQPTVNGSTPPPGMAAGIKVFQFLGAGVVSVIWCVLPVLILLMWRSPRVIAAFEKPPEPPFNSGLPAGY